MFIKPSVKDQTKALLSAALEISRLDTSKMFEAKSSIQLSQQVEHLLLTKERESGTLEKVSQPFFFLAVHLSASLTFL